MKTVFLILYFWHGTRHESGGGFSAAAPQMIMQQMPTLAACEAVGAAAKDLADRNRPNPSTGYGRMECGSMLCRTVGSDLSSPPAVYRCVEVPR